MEGYVKLFRNLLDWEWYQDENVLRLYIHFLLRANFEDKQWHGIAIKQGSFVTSFKTLHTELGLSSSQLRTAIKKLANTNYIKTEASNKYTIITLLDWNKTQVLTANKKVYKATKKESLNDFQEERNMRFGGNYYVVKKRDKYKCSECSNSNNLLVHHIIPYDPDNEITTKIENLVTVCKDCHNKLHFSNNINFPILPRKETLERINFHNGFIVEYENILEEFKNGNL